MSATIAALPTIYKGHEFRSRLEARWAIFFDCMGWKWEYEPEAVVTRHGGYLVDFRLPELNCYAEIKPQEFSQDEKEKLIDAAYAFDSRIMAFVGHPSESHAYVGVSPDGPRWRLPDDYEPGGFFKSPDNDGSYRDPDLGTWFEAVAKFYLLEETKGGGGLWYLETWPGEDTCWDAWDISDVALDAYPVGEVVASSPPFAVVAARAAKFTNGKLVYVPGNVYTRLAVGLA